MEALKLGNHALSRAAGVGPITLAEYCLGDLVPDAATRTKIAEALIVTSEELWCDCE